jgi:hypothetical protein
VSGRYGLGLGRGGLFVQGNFGRDVIYGSNRVAPSERLMLGGGLDFNLSRCTGQVGGSWRRGLSFITEASQFGGFSQETATAGFAGALIAPLTLTGATMGSVLGLKAFAVAIIGGLTSGLGIIVGGIILGIAETTTGFYISTGYKDVPGLVLLLLVLAVKPAGLFGKSAIKKV